MESLPIDSVLPEIEAELASPGNAVIVAEPGAGKTTRVPLALKDAAWLGDRRIVMLEPRRLAARAAAARMAETLSEPVGATVGYTVRLERKVSRETRIEIVTEGILTRRLQADPELSGIGLLIFDEFHERSLDGDLALALALDVQRALRPDLRIMAMSASLDETRLSAYLGDAPVIAAKGRVFPVATSYGERPEPRQVAEGVARAVLAALADTRIGILAFLPGEAEIRKCAAILSGRKLPDDVRVLPLYGAMPLSEQVEAISPAAGVRKIVLATTIAETSLTIAGIDTVIDSGLKRAPRFDPASGMTSLKTLRVSRASAEQRRGRAGRVGPGRCVRLWPEEEMRALKAHDEPEILQADLASFALELSAWGASDPAALSWLDPPPPAAFAQARELLSSLDAVTGEGKITPVGKAMAALPLHPRLAHMMIEAKHHGSGGLGADLAALLSERDSLGRDAGADIDLRMAALKRDQRIRDAARQLRSLARIERDEKPKLSTGVLVALAWPDRIARARGGRGRFQLSGGGGAILAEHDPLAREKWLAVATTDGAAGDQRIFLAARLTLEEIERHFGSHIEMRDIIAWDERAEAVVMARQRRLGKLSLAESPIANPDPGLVADAMITGIKAMGLAALPWSEAARSFAARISLLRRLFPEEEWPDLGETGLAANLGAWLAPYLAGMTRKAHLAQLDLAEILRARLPYAMQQRLAQLAPTHVTIPSGASIAIDYSGAGDPVLRAQLQEMFGLTETPRIAEGRARLRIELLSPARRPLAVTQDLASFWANAYPQVRGEMRGRYPKHRWPENPLAAPPVKPGKLR
jgi:ATP-dependent helicase HrpB